MLQHESGIGAQILIDLGLTNMRVLTNHPRKLVALEGYGLTIADQEPIQKNRKKFTTPPTMFARKTRPLAFMCGKKRVGFRAIFPPQSRFCTRK